MHGCVRVCAHAVSLAGCLCGSPAWLARLLTAPAGAVGCVQAREPDCLRCVPLRLVKRKRHGLHTPWCC